MSLDRGVDEFLASLRAERGLAPATISAYRRDLGQWVAFLEGREPTPAEASAWVASLSRKGLAPATIARKVAAVRGLHRFLVAEGLAGEDPTLLLEAPRRGRSLPKALTVEEVLRLLDSPDPATTLGSAAGTRPCSSSSMPPGPGWPRRWVSIRSTSTWRAPAPW